MTMRFDVKLGREGSVPEGQAKVARRFIAGWDRKGMLRPVGTDETNTTEKGAGNQACLRDAPFAALIPVINRRATIRCPCGTWNAFAAGFTLMEMMITLAIFILLAAAVFGILGGVLESTSTLQDNQNHKDETAALSAFLKKKLGQMPVGSTLASYQRGDGDGLVQNGIVFGTADLASVIDAKTQSNGYYTLRLATYTAGATQGVQQDARQLLQQAVTTDDPTLAWTPLITDIKTLDWKFLDFNQTQWVEVWNNPVNPNLVEFSMQPSGELQPVTMDFWLPKIDAINLNAAPQRTLP